MKTLRTFGLATLVFLLLAATSLLIAQAPDRSAPPKLGPPPSLHLPPVRHLKLSNGLPVVMMEKHSLPIVEAVLLVKAGSADDPKDLSGCATMTAAMMEEGAGARSSLELADAIDFLGASISVGAGTSSMSVTMHTQLSRLDSALALFGDIALRPTFPREELERNRLERLTTLQQRHDEPRAVASVLFSRTIFGDNHPYGIPSIGNEKSLRALTTADLKNFHDSHFFPGNSTLIIVGDVTPETILPKLESVLGGWKDGSSVAARFPDAKQVEGRTVYLVDKPGAPQSEIRIGRLGYDRSTPDFYAIQVMNTILGGSFTSRLNQNLREEHGYTYGAGSSFDFRPHPGPFLAYAAVQTQVTDSSLIQFFNELNGIRANVTDDEVDRARNYITLGYPENFQTIAGVAGELAELVQYHLPDDYFNTYTERIRSVTKEDVLRVASKSIDTANMAIIIVGDKATIEKKVAALNLGPIKLLSIDDVLGPAPVLNGAK
jgi:zinc protease